MEAIGAGEVEVSLVQRRHDHGRRELAEHTSDRARRVAIVIEGALKEGGLRATPHRFGDRHPSPNSVGTCSVRGGLHHAALVPPATDDQQLELAELRMALATYLDEEGVEVHVHDSCAHRTFAATAGA